MTQERVIPKQMRMKELAGPAARAFFGLSRAWSLSVDEQVKLLGLSKTSTLAGWAEGQVADADPEVIERISYLLGIFKAINTLLPDPQRADAWIRASNDAVVFGGRSALERMMTGQIEDLQVVRQYLDAQVG
jgi:hypothetical protein